MSRRPSGTDASAPALARVRAALLGWYAVEQRDFPWRRTRDPWAVLVSEVMLQQTQASRVAERFPVFMARYPTARSLAESTDAEALAAWSGLGYNRRALALRRAAAAVTSDDWPRGVTALERLPGIGPYTAHAVASLAFGEPVGVVDTNVRRWLVRRFGLSPDAPSRDLQALADALALAGRSADAAPWTHATMEFGARVCSTRNPLCDVCPIARGCPSRGMAARVPVARQPAFAGSSRAARGAVLRGLAVAPGHRLPLAAVRRLADVADIDRLVAGLERDGLAHRSDGRLVLGGPADAGSPATIGP